MMESIMNFFDEWKVSVTPRTYEDAPDASGVWQRTPTDLATANVILWNRSAAERYFSQQWAEDVSDVLAMDSEPGFDSDAGIVYNGLEYAVDSIVNVGEQSEVWLVGLKVHK